MTGRHCYAELHAHSVYSFLDGANEPDDLASAAVELGLEALALTDHDGVPGIVKHAQAGRTHGLPTIHGTELTLADGSHLPVLARNPTGYRRLVIPLLDAEGNSAWPERFRAEEIAALRRRVGPLRFARQMLLQAVAESAARLDPALVVRYAEEPEYREAGGRAQLSLMGRRLVSGGGF